MNATPRIDALLTRMDKKLAAQGFGAAADLARHLGVKQQHVQVWQSRRAKPGGETTLKLLEWLAL